MELKITKEKVLKAVEENPEAKKVLESLFPEAFEDTRVFCRIGSILVRGGSESNYALFKWNGEVRLLNIINNYFWNNDKPLSVKKLHDTTGEYITNGEFDIILHGKSNYNYFKVIKIQL